MTTAILRISDAVSRRTATDDAGPRAAALAEAAGAVVAAMEVLPDDFALIEDRLHHFADDGLDLVLTVGGIGAAAGDVTTEATRAVIERDAPGVAEAVRAAGRAADPDTALFWRGTAGWRGSTLIVNLPGEHLDVVLLAIAPVLTRG